MGMRLKTAHLHSSSSSARLVDNNDVSSENFLALKRLHLDRAKLKMVAKLSSWLTGFSVVAMVELQINHSDVNVDLLIAFGLTTSILVGSNMMALMIAYCILPQIEAVEGVSHLQSLSSITRSPHESMNNLVQTAWVVTSIVSPFLFTLDLVLMFWIKFRFFSRAASICGTIILIPVLLTICTFAIYFYRQMIGQKLNKATLEVQELESIINNLNQVEICMTPISPRLNSNPPSPSASTIISSISNNNFDHGFINGFINRNPFSYNNLIIGISSIGSNSNNLNNSPPNSTSGTSGIRRNYSDNNFRQDSSPSPVGSSSSGVRRNVSFSSDTRHSSKSYSNNNHKRKISPAISQTSHRHVRNFPNGVSIV